MIFIWAYWLFIIFIPYVLKSWFNVKLLIKLNNNFFFWQNRRNNFKINKFIQIRNNSCSNHFISLRCCIVVVVEFLIKKLIQRMLFDIDLWVVSKNQHFFQGTSVKRGRSLIYWLPEKNLFWKFIFDDVLYWDF